SAGDGCAEPGEYTRSDASWLSQPARRPSFRVDPRVSQGKLDIVLASLTPERDREDESEPPHPTKQTSPRSPPHGGGAQRPRPAWGASPPGDVEGVQGGRLTRKVCSFGQCLMVAYGFGHLCFWR